MADRRSLYCKSQHQELYYLSTVYVRRIQSCIKDFKFQFKKNLGYKNLHLVLFDQGRQAYDPPLFFLHCFQSNSYSLHLCIHNSQALVLFHPRQTSFLRKSRSPIQDLGLNQDVHPNGGMVYKCQVLDFYYFSKNLCSCLCQRHMSAYR